MCTFSSTKKGDAFFTSPFLLKSLVINLLSFLRLLLPLVLLLLSQRWEFLQTLLLQVVLLLLRQPVPQ